MIELTPEQLIQSVVAVGPALLGVVGVLLTGVFALLGWLGGRLWNAHIAKMDELVQSNQALKSYVEQHEKETERRFNLNERTIHHLQADLRLSGERMDNIRMSLVACETSIKGQTAEIKDYTKQIVIIDSKLTAVFREIDARRRATDLRHG